MKVSVAEFKKDIDRYLEKVGDEEIIVINNGTVIATLVPPTGKAAIIRSLRGTLPNTATVEEARGEKLAKHSGS